MSSSSLASPQAYSKSSVSCVTNRGHVAISKSLYLNLWEDISLFTQFSPHLTTFSSPSACIYEMVLTAQVLVIEIAFHIGKGLFHAQCNVRPQPGVLWGSATLAIILSALEMTNQDQSRERTALLSIILKILVCENHQKMFE